MRRLFAIAAAIALATGTAQAQQKELASFLPQARRLMKEAPFIDSHNDLPEMLEARSHGDFRKEDPEQPIKRLDTDLPRL